MKQKKDFITIILIIIIIVLVCIIGIVGYSMYIEITEQENKILNFIGDLGTSSLGNKQSNTDIDKDMFNGVEQRNSTSNVEIKNRKLYDQLEDSGKKIYDRLYDSREKLKTGKYTVEFGKEFSELLLQPDGYDKLQEQYQSAIEALTYENPEFFYLDVTSMYLNIEELSALIIGKRFNVYIDKGKKESYLSEGLSSKEDVERCEKEIEQVTNSILAQIDGKSDYEKIKIVHDYLVDTVEYESTLMLHNIYDMYGALVSKKSVCEGYAKAFQYLMNKAGIENIITIGTATNSKGKKENHAWNYVKLEDNWYAVDVTWDDPVVVGGREQSKESRYRYFLIGSNKLFKNHTESLKFTKDGKEFAYPTLSVSDYEHK